MSLYKELVFSSSPKVVRPGRAGGHSSGLTVDARTSVCVVIVVGAWQVSSRRKRECLRSRAVWNAYRTARKRLYESRRSGSGTRDVPYLTSDRGGVPVHGGVNSAVVAISAVRDRFETHVIDSARRPAT